MTARILYIGIDAGGSRSRLAAKWSDEDAVIRLDGPGVNARLLGNDRAADVLADLVGEVHTEAAARLVVAAGVAGAGRPADREGLRTALAQRLAVAAGGVQIVADADLALDAAFGREGGGLAIISGTGSIAYARDDHGVVYRAGGWGRILGDEGGGYHLGVSGLQGVADALDGGPPTALRALAATMWDTPDPASLLQAVYDKGRSPASFAPLVLEAAWNGDPVAQRIVSDATEALALRASWAVVRAGTVPRRFALIGGLTEHSGYRAALVRAIRDVLPGWSLVRMTVQPVEAALQRALTLTV